MKMKGYPRPINRRTCIKGQMNSFEAAYESELRMLKLAGEILDYAYEPIKFKLATKTFYTPDFLVVHKEYFELVEVKGFLEEDANVKFKAIAEKFPFFKWRMIQGKKRLGKIEFSDMKEF